MMGANRRKLWFAGFVLLVFALGLGTGVAVDRHFLYGFARFAPADGDRPAAGPRRSPPPPAEVADRLTRDLALSDEQRQEIERVFARGAERLSAFRDASRQQFDALRAQLHEEIEAVLTPEQRAKFQETMKSRRRGDGPPPDRQR